MKKVMPAVLIAAITGLFPVLSKAEMKTGTPINRTAQAVDTTIDMDVSQYRSFSFQVTYDSVTPSAATFTDGTVSQATFTVVDYELLQGRKSTATITLADGKNAGASGSVITINGRAFTEGTDWNYDTSYATQTMKNLQTAINASPLSAEMIASISSNVITLASISSGTTANSWTVQSSTPAALNLNSDTTDGTTNFFRGQTAGWLEIGGYRLTEGADFTAATSSDVTANAIEDAINADTDISAIVVASNTAAGKVRILSQTTGINAYALNSSLWTALSYTDNKMVSGAASDISLSANSITEASHGFSSGLAVLFSTSSNSTAPTGLTNQTTYYVIPVNANSFKLSDTSTGAVAGVTIDITAVAGGGTFTLTPLAFAKGSLGWNWQGSNDGTNFATLAATYVSSTTYSADATELFSFPDYPYKWLRFNFTGPTTGGLDITGVFNGIVE